MIFKSDNGALLARSVGETVRVEVWGKNGLRVRATKLSQFTGKVHALT